MLGKRFAGGVDLSGDLSLRFALLAPFRCKIQVYDPWLPARTLARQGVKPVGLEELLATSQVIYVLAIPSASNKSRMRL